MEGSEIAGRLLPVGGETERVNSRVLKWYSTSTDLGGGFFLGAQYSLSVVGIEDLAGNPADESAMSFTHLAGVEGQLLIARQAPTDSYPMAESTYGLTTLPQGRTWHGDLGMYYYRARWYLPDGGVFGERDPLGRIDGQNAYNTLRFNPTNFQDPRGEQAYVVYRAFNGPFLKRAYSLVGHFFLAFDERDLGKVQQWRQEVDKWGRQRNPRRETNPDAETFSFHPAQVREITDPSTGLAVRDPKTRKIMHDTSLSLGSTFYTRGSYVGYNDKADQDSFMATRDGLPDPNNEILDSKIDKLNVSDAQQYALYKLANVSRRINNASAGANDIDWYRVLTNNCGTWARFMVELAGLNWPAEANMYNGGGAGVGGFQDWLPFTYTATGIAMIYGETLGRGEYFAESQKRRRDGGSEADDRLVVGWRKRW